MNIVLDGLSGVGKTYVGRRLANRLDMNFYEFLPDIENNSEVSLHSFALKRQQLNDNTVIEGSFIMSYVVKQYMFAKGLLSLNQLLKIKQIEYQELPNIQPFIILYFTDTNDVILNRRKQRDREFEFRPELDDISDLDNYITTNYESTLQQYKSKLNHLWPNVSVIRVDRSKFSNISELLDRIVERIASIIK